MPVSSTVQDFFSILLLLPNDSSPGKGKSRLQLSGTDNGRRVVVLDLAGAAAGGLDGLDDPHRLVVGNLAEDDVLAIEPGGHDGGDEELRAVAGDGGDRLASSLGQEEKGWGCDGGRELWSLVVVSGLINLRVGSGISHGQKARTAVLNLEVLIGKLLAVDGFTAGTLTVVITS